MAWVKLDDGFPEHPKVAQAGDLAAWLYVCGLTYANRRLTDGFIPDSIVPRLTGLKSPVALAKRLVAAGLWDLAEGGYQIHDYLTYQPSAAKVAQERQASADRMAVSRGRRNAPSIESVAPEHPSNGGNGCVGSSPATNPPREEEEEEPGPGRSSQLKNPPIREEPEQAVAASPPAATPSSDLLDRVNQTLTGQPGWEPTLAQLLKLGQIADQRGVDLELEALKIADYMRKPKRKDTQCTFRFVATWLERERTNGSNGHGENRQHPGRNGAGSRGAAAGTGAGRPGGDDPFAQYVIRDEPAAGDPGGP